MYECGQRSQDRKKVLQQVEGIEKRTENLKIRKCLMPQNRTE